MAGMSKSTMYRVSDLPRDEDEPEVQSQLQSTIQDLLTDDEKQRLKFKVAHIPSCDNDETSSALLEFLGGQPEFLSDLSVNPLGDWQAEMGDVDINFDRHFFGFTQLYKTPTGKPITADIIAITGLDGHAFGSWKGKGNLGRMWLRDFLSKDLPCCRVMTYGYNSKLSSHGVDTIMDYGRDFLEKLKRVRSTREAWERPLIFIAHSFGGIILAHCLVKAAQADERDHPTISSLRKAAYAVLFFGTPHRGMLIDDIQRLILGKECDSRLNLTQQIKLKSDILSHQLADFINLARDLEIVSFYERQQTRRLEFDEQSQTWARTGSYMTAVDSESALLQLPDSMEKKVNVDADHSMMVKFDSRSNQTYKIAIEYLKQFEQRAQESIPRRFALSSTSKARIRPVSTVPFSRDTAFVERLDARGQDIISNLTSQFAQTDTHKRLALVGLGGIGKSQIAIEYSYRARLRDPQLWVFWVYAASIEKFEQSYREVAARLELPDWNNRNLDIFSMVSRWMNDPNNGRWLLILDNADDIEALKGTQQGQRQDTIPAKTSPPLWSYIPQSNHGSVLITTRDRGAAQLLGGVESIIQMKTMDPNEAVQLLRTKLYSGSEPTLSEATALVKELDYIPLAITQAAAYISVEAPMMSVPSFLALYQHEDNKSRLLDLNLGDLRRDQGLPNSVLRTWQISFDQIKRNASTRAAADLLSLMAVYERQGIPQSLLCGLTKESFDFYSAISPLVRFSLVIMESDGRTFQMHRLVQLATRRWLSVNGQIDKWREMALATLSKSFPYAHYENWETCRVLLPHAVEVLQSTSASRLESHLVLERATLLFNTASYNFEQGRYATAVQLSQESLSLRQSLLESDHEDVLRSMHAVAEGLFEQGNYQEAESRFRQVVDMKRKLNPLETPDVVLSLAGLSKTYAFRSRLKDAEEIALQVLEIRRRKEDGERHPETLSGMSSLVFVYYTQGRLAEASELGLRTLNLQKVIRGEEHPDTLTTMGYLALIYREMDRWREAEELSSRVLQITKRILGEDHPKTLTSMAYLATVYGIQWRWSEAEALLVRVVDAHKTLLGSEHPLTLTDMGELAWMYSAQGRAKEAEELLTQVLNVEKNIHGAEDAKTMQCMSSLASMYFDHGRYKESRDLNMQVLSMAKKDLKRRLAVNEEDPETLIRMTLLAELHEKMDQPKAAEQLYLQVFQIKQKLLGDRHPDTLQSLTPLASIYYHTGKLKDAVELLLRGLDTAKDAMGDEHLITLGIMASLSMTYTEYGRFKEAEKIQKQLLEIVNQVLGDEHSDTVQCMRDLVHIYQCQQRYDKAEELGQQILAIHVKSVGDEHPRTLQCMLHLARIHREWGIEHKDKKHLEKAEELIKQVVRDREKAWGKEHVGTLRCLEFLVSSYRDQCRWDEAKCLGLQLLDTRRRLYGESNPGTLNCAMDLANTYSYAGRAADLEQLMERIENPELAWDRNPNHTKAEELTLQILETSKNELGEEHADTLSYMECLITIYRDQNRWDEAESMGLQLLEIWRRLSGEEHPSTLRCAMDLADTYNSPRRPSDPDLLKKTEEIVTHVLEIRKKIYGNEHPKTIDCIEELISTYEEQGRYEEVQGLILEILDIRTKSMGAEHSITVECMERLVHTYVMLGLDDDSNAKKAKEMQECVLSIRKKSLGEKHSATLKSAMKLATIYDFYRLDMDLYALKRAEELYLQVLDATEVLGKENRDILRCMNNLAMLYQSHNRDKEASDIYLELLEIKIKSLGEENTTNLRTMDDLLRAYGDQDRWRDAEDLCLRILDIRQRTLGEEDSETLRSIRELSRIRSCQCQLQEAENLIRHVINVHKRCFGESHKDSLKYDMDLARILNDQCQFEEAKALALRALETQKKIYGEEDMDTLWRVLDVTTITRQSSDQSDLLFTEQLFLGLMEMRKSISGDKDSLTTYIMMQLVFFYRDLDLSYGKGYLKKAEELALQVLGIRHETLGDANTSTLNCMMALASIYNRQARWKEAEDLILRASGIYKSFLGDSHPYTRECLIDLERTYGDQGRMNEVEQLGLQMVDVQQRTLGAENPGTLGRLVDLANIYMDKSIHQGLDPFQGVDEVRDRSYLMKAEELVQQVLRVSEPIVGEYHSSHLSFQVFLTKILRCSGRADKAVEYCQRIVGIRQKTLGMHHEETLDSAMSLAIAYTYMATDCDLTYLKRAEELVIQTLESSDQILGKEHRRTLQCMSELALIWFKQGKLEEAEQLLTEVMDIRERAWGKDHSETLVSKCGIAVIKKKQGHHQRALELMVECAELSIAKFGPDYPEARNRQSLVDGWR